MKAAVVLALVAFAQVVVAFSDDSLTLDAWQTDATATVRAQRALLQSSPSSGSYSPRYSPSPIPSPSPVRSPAYSPSPVPSPSYSPTPSPVASPKASPSPSPVASPLPARSPKVCKFAKTANVNFYSVTITSTKNWGAGRDAIVKATNAVYAAYSQKKYKVKVTGAPGQFPQVPDYDFTYLIEVPVTPCVGFKEGLRAKLRTAIKTVKAKGQKRLYFGIVA